MKIKIFQLIKKIKSGNYYRTISIKKFEVFNDDDGSKIEFPIESVDYIQIDYLAWTLQCGLWIAVVIMVIKILNKKLI